jgi:hypothetical protein
MKAMPDRRKGYYQTKSREWILGNCMACPQYILEQHLDWPIKVNHCHAFKPPRMLTETFNWHSCPLRAKLPFPWRQYPEGSPEYLFFHRQVAMEVFFTDEPQHGSGPA